MKEIYLDNNATTKVAPEVVEVMTSCLSGHYGNASSVHFKGVDAERILKNARQTVSRLLEVPAKSIVFTSGGTESNNTIIKGLAAARKKQETGKKIPGPKPEPPEPGPQDTDQVNFTELESGIMLTSSNGWQQAWNAQSAVDMDSHLMVAGHISQAPNDKQEQEPQVQALADLPAQLGQADPGPPP